VGTIVIGLLLDVLEGVIFDIGTQAGSLDERNKGLQFVLQVIDGDLVELEVVFLEDALDILVDMVYLQLQ
jgi:hypothetical protein